MGEPLSSALWASSSSECLLNRWLHTGDEVKFDEQGEMYVVDRLKARKPQILEASNHADVLIISRQELIKVRGFQVAPAGDLSP